MSNCDYISDTTRNSKFIAKSEDLFNFHKIEFPGGSR